VLGSQDWHLVFNLLPGRASALLGPAVDALLVSV